MKNYITVTYCNKPKTNYPVKLIKYLFRDKGLKHHFKLYEKVLDLGSGRGDFLLAFWENQFKVEGFDQCSPDKTLINKYEVTLGNIEKPLPYKNNTFDIVFCKSVIEHLYYPEKVFKEVNRILKPEGCFIVMTPDYESTKDIFHYDFTHRTPFTLNSLEEIYKIHGFNKVECKKIRQLPSIWTKPWLKPFFKFCSLFYSPRTKNKIIKFSQELMLLGIGVK